MKGRGILEALPSFVFIFILTQGKAAEPRPGSVDLSFEPVVILSEFQSAAPGWGKVIGLALGPDDEIYIGGHFTEFFDVSEQELIAGNGIARLEEDGSLDRGFSPPVYDPSTPEGQHLDVHDIFVDDGGMAWAGWGDFNWRFETDGTLHSIGTEGYEFSRVTTIYPDGRFLAGGQETNDLRWEVARFFSSGELDESFNPLPGGGLDNRLVLDSGKLLVPAASYDPTGELVYSGLLERRNEDGTLDEAYAAPDFGEEIRSLQFLIERGNGQVYVGGGFSTVNGEPRPPLIRLNEDGTVDESFQLDERVLNSSATIRSIALQPNGKLVLGGLFEGAEIVGAICRLNRDGSLDTSFDPGTGATEGHDEEIIAASIFGVAVQQDGKIVVTGDFQKFDGIPRDGVVRLWGDPIEPLTIETITKNGEQIVLEVTGTADVIEVEASETIEGEWEIIRTVAMLDEGATEIEIEAAGYGTRFFRVRRL